MITDTHMLMSSEMNHAIIKHLALSEQSKQQRQEDEEKKRPPGSFCSSATHHWGSHYDEQQHQGKQDHNKKERLQIQKGKFKIPQRLPNKNAQETGSIQECYHVNRHNLKRKVTHDTDVGRQRGTPQSSTNHKIATEKEDRNYSYQRNMKRKNTTGTLTTGYQYGNDGGDCYNLKSKPREGVTSLMSGKTDPNAINSSHSINYNMMARMISPSVNLPLPSRDFPSSQVHAAFLCDRSYQNHEATSARLFRSSYYSSPFFSSFNNFHSWKHRASKTTMTPSNSMVSPFSRTTVSSSCHQQPLVRHPGPSSSSTQHPQLSSGYFLNGYRKAQEEGFKGGEDRKIQPSEYFIPPNLLESSTVGANDAISCSSSTKLSSFDQSSDTVSTEVDKGVAARRFEHFSTRPYMALSLPDDKLSLSPFLCFLRKECIEVFKADASMVEDRKCNKIILHQVGIRCRFCAHLLNNKSRANRSSSFPSSSCRIYQTLNVMINEHLPSCQFIPLHVTAKMDELKQLKTSTKSSKVYWTDSAEFLGMRNAENGMFMVKPLKLRSPCSSSVAASY